MGAYAITLTNTTAGTSVTQPRLPWSSEYRPDATELSQAGNDIGRVRLATLNSFGAWVGVDCTATDTALECVIPHLSVFAAVITPPPSDTLDAPLDNGWFYKEANGFNGAGSSGFPVVDDSDANMWSEFQRGILQSDPDEGVARPANVMNDITAVGLDVWLDQTRHTPPATTGDDLSLLDDYPAFGAYFASNADVETTYGMPLAVKVYSNQVAARLERGVL